MQLALRNNRRGVIPLPSLRQAYGIGKRVYAYFKNRRSKKKTSRASGATAAVPTNYGRTITRFKVNLPKMLKKGLKHCRSLKLQKLKLFKATLQTRLNRIYKFVGEYKAFAINCYDDNTYSVPGNAAKPLIVTNAVYGSALGNGRHPADFSNDAAVAYSYALEVGPAFGCCLDIPTSDTYPELFTDEFSNGTLRLPRKFGMLDQSPFGDMTLTALNNTTDRTWQDISPTNYITDQDVLRVYTLSYKYTMYFTNMTQWDYRVYVFQLRLNHFQSNDTQNWGGFSNMLNYYLTRSTNTDPHGFFEGKLPSSLVKVVRRKTFILRGAHKLEAQQAQNGKNYRKVVVKSPPAYLSVAKRPTNTEPDVSIAIDGKWWNESYENYNYMYVYAVPASREIWGTDASPPAPATRIPPAQILMRIRKETTYGVMKD